jgi:hypothetical protein
MHPCIVYVNISIKIAHVYANKEKIKRNLMFLSIIFENEKHEQR